MREGPSFLRSILDLPVGPELLDRRTVESGQLVVDKQKAWEPLMLATYMQAHTYFFDNLVSCYEGLLGVASDIFECEPQLCFNSPYP